MLTRLPSRPYLSGTILSLSLGIGLITSACDGNAASPPLPPIAGPDSITMGEIHLNNSLIHYKAIAGSLLVYGRKHDDSASIMAQRDEVATNRTIGEKTAPGGHEENRKAESNPARASMFYTAYFLEGHPAQTRPVIFFYNGGPGSSSAWLHLGSFGPYRLNTPGDMHLPAAPYKLIENPQTLLNDADLVFIDAPGTGFSRITGKNAEKEFYGLEGDSSAFTHFIMQFLAKYTLFNAPKYLFGESYGTLRSALVANKLAQEENIDLNGIILLSQILNYDHSVDGADANPGIDLPYILALPSYSATAWYHQALPMQKDKTARQGTLEDFLHDVEHFATTDYAQALQKGNLLTDDQKNSIAQKLHDYTGIPVSYWIKANLRLTGGMFEHKLLADQDLTTGRLDSRYSGPNLEPTERNAAYDPQASALGSAYVSLANLYLRQTLHYGGTTRYKDLVPSIEPSWRNEHILPNGQVFHGTPNVMPDLAMALKTNPKLHIMLNSGYYDLATPYYEGMYEMAHLPIPSSLQKNISIYHYAVGHMVYVDPAALQQLHDHVAEFLQKTKNTPNQ